MSTIGKLKDDQGRINTALEAMNITWYKKGTLYDQAYYGITPDGLKVTVLPHIEVCRHGRCKVKNLESGVQYVWHRGGSKNAESKFQGVSDSGLWYLMTDWESITNRTNSRGDQWLREITDWS